MLAIFVKIKNEWEFIWLIYQEVGKWMHFLIAGKGESLKDGNEIIAPK